MMYLESVYLFVKSSLMSAENYGDIAWFKGTQAERELYSNPERVKVFNGVFAIAGENTKLNIKSDKIYYERLVILPKMDIDGIHYEYGNMIGVFKTGQIDFRGVVFDDLSPREEVILCFLFNEYINDALESNLKVLDLFKRTTVPGVCRIGLIENIRTILVRNLIDRKRI
jgi:hypothetical protein